MPDLDAILNALVSAFPTAGHLTRFARTHFPEAAAGLGWSNLQTGAFDLIEWAIAEDRLDRLIAAAWQEVPDSPALRALGSGSLWQEPMAVEAIARVPPGPRVPLERIDDRIIDAFAAAGHTRVRAHLFLLAANRLRRAMDPKASVVRFHELPHFDLVGPQAFWFETVANACLHGPRMVASLLIAHRPRLTAVDASVADLLTALERGSYRANQEAEHA
ncbi:MAG TPA: effector-associated domain EAD1-containing protein [Vicinamibacterales bacterium]|nr:effector-associated domain EAD1-containing protein [Vicinamibacterales bacterium]